MLRQVALLGVVLVAGTAAQTAQAARVQVALPYNVDVVQEVGGTTTALVAPGIGGEALVSQAFAEANDTTDPRGLPNNGLFLLDDGPLQLGPYNANNAVRLLPQQSTGQISVPQAQYKRFDVYVLAGDGRRQLVPPPTTITDTAPVPLRAFFSFVGTGTGSQGMQISNFLADPVEVVRLIDGMDLTGMAGLGFTDVDDAAVFRYSFEILGAEFIGPLGGVRFLSESSFSALPINDDPAHNRPVFILAATVDTNPVPEPSALALLGVGTLLVLQRKRSNR